MPRQSDEAQELTDRPQRVRGLAAQTPLRYLAAGAMSFIVDFGLLALFHEVFRWPVTVATGASFLISFFFTYSIQRVFSFSATTPHGRALLRYAILVGFNTLATVGIVDALTVTPLNWAGGKIIATIVTTAWNYFAYRHWVFAHPPRQTEGAV
jgi:putative flippase GtrA